MKITKEEIASLEEIAAYLAEEEEDHEVWEEENGEDDDDGLGHIWGHVQVLERFLQRARKDNGSFYRVLKLAQTALNTAPRFKVPSLSPEFGDSYKIAAEIDRVLMASKGE